MRTTPRSRPVRAAVGLAACLLAGAATATPLTVEHFYLGGQTRFSAGNDTSLRLVIDLDDGGLPADGTGGIGLDSVEFFFRELPIDERPPGTVGLNLDAHLDPAAAAACSAFFTSGAYTGFNCHFRTPLIDGNGLRTNIDVANPGYLLGPPDQGSISTFVNTFFHFKTFGVDPDRDIVITRAVRSQAPEPMTATLTALALVGVALRRARRRRTVADRGPGGPLQKANCSTFVLQAS